MKTHTSILRVLIMVLIFSAFTFPANEPLKKIIDSLGKFTLEAPQEKVYLHTDKDIYASGEDLWFKSYSVIGPYHNLSSYSKNLYVELIDNQNTLVDRRIVRVENGLGMGDFKLPSNLTGGVYHLRAYTNWMKNFDEEFHFLKPIEIIGIQDSTVQEPEVSEPQIDLQFFPEGGDLVAGVGTRLAFKSINASGLGVNIQGQIFTDEGAEVTKFESTRLGMGMLFFLPEKGVNYYATIAGLERKFSLPKVAESGYMMAVNPIVSDEYISVTVKRNDETPGGALYLLAHNSGQVYYSAEFVMNANIAVIRIPKKELPTGILHLTIFDENSRPRSERLAFHDNNDALQIDLTTDKDVYTPREKITLSLDVKDSIGNPVVGSFSIAVTDQTQVGRNNFSGNIQSDILLTSDLKGLIEFPEIYFDKENAQRYEQLDLLLMTQGWRRFDWSQIINDQLPPLEFENEKSISLTGTLVTKRRQEPVAKGRIDFLNLSTVPPLNFRYTTDNNGKFSIDNLDFNDSSKVVLQGSTRKKQKNVTFLMDQKDFQPLNNFNAFNTNQLYSSFTREVFAQRSNEREQIEKAFNFDPDVIRLDDVTVYGDEYKENRPIARTYGSGDVSFNIREISESAPTMSAIEILAGRISGLVINRSSSSPDGVSVTIRGSNSIELSVEPLFLLDNTPVDLPTLLTTPAMMIEDVEVFKGASAAIFGARGSNGVLAFYTRRGAGTSDDYQRPSVQEGLVNINLLGYAFPRQFYAPVYDQERPEDIKPDRRALIHWAPNLVTNEGGEATISFYNADLPTTVRIDVQGISIDGVPGVQSKTFEVKK